MRLLITLELLLCFSCPALGCLVLIAFVIKEASHNIVFVSLALMAIAGLYGVVKLYVYLMDDSPFEKLHHPSKILYLFTFMGFAPLALGGYILIGRDAQLAGVVPYLLALSPFFCVIHFFILSVRKSKVRADPSVASL